MSRNLCIEMDWLYIDSLFGKHMANILLLKLIPTYYAEEVSYK